MEHSFVIEDDKDRRILELTREVEEWKRKAGYEERQHQAWKNRCQEVTDTKNRLMTHSTLYNRLDEVESTSESWRSPSDPLTPLT